MNTIERLIRAQDRLAQRLRDLEIKSTQADPAGWLPHEETWTYASATTFTVASDITGRFQAGDAVRWKQGGAFLHGRIVSVTYSSPNSTVTISGDAIAAATITDNYYSKAYSPQGLSPQRWVFGKWTSTSWDGDAKGTADNGVIDLSTVFGLPAGILAVSVALHMTDNNLAAWCSIAQDDTLVSYGVICNTQVANREINNHGIVQCDANGDVYFKTNTDLTSVKVYINGYCIEG